MFKVLIPVFLLSMVPVIALADMVKSTITASNGVAVDKETDDFAQRYEYTSPVVVIDLPNPATGLPGHGWTFAVKIRRNTEISPLQLQGGFSYVGDWLHFSSAIFKGGAEADFHALNSSVGDCSGGCTLNESFAINFTPAQVKEHTQDGIVAVQLRAQNGTTVIFNVPVTYFDAVNEIAK
jgi:hypothetical protein